MRVIAGSCKGRRLSPPRWEGLRPTSDRLRETLYGILGDGVVGRRVLDGCAGTGAVGIEALSRGATHVVFVDQDPRAVALIRRNVATCGLTDRCAIVRGTLPGALGRLGRSRFDLVLLDPPYGGKGIGAILTATAGYLETGGLVVLERARRQDLVGSSGLEVLRSVRAGDSVLDFYTHSAERSVTRKT